MFTYLSVTVILFNDVAENGKAVDSITTPFNEFPSTISMLNNAFILTELVKVVLVSFSVAHQKLPMFQKVRRNLMGGLDLLGLNLEISGEIHNYPGQAI